MALAFNVPPLGTRSVGGVNNYPRQGVEVGAIQCVTLVSGSDIANGVTAEFEAEWNAPFACLVREISYSNRSMAATATFTITNTTQSNTLCATQTPVTATSTRLQGALVTNPVLAEGDLITVAATTSGGAGAIKGLNVWLTIVPTADSGDNQYAT